MKGFPVAHVILYYLLAWIVLGILAYSLRGRQRRRRDLYGPRQGQPPPPGARPRDDHADGGDA